MNLLNIIEEIEKVDPEFNERISPRRDAIKNITSFGSKVAVAALPFALGTLFNRAYGAAIPTDVTGVLNFALTLEYLESTFYTRGLAANIVPASDTAYITSIAKDEANHVTALQALITSLQGTPVTPPTFDFTGGNGADPGPFPDVMTNYQTFLSLAQVFEDTGVRAYKGEAPALAGNQAVLTAALSIHAVEARHASAIRYLRTKSYGASVTPWITSITTGNDTGIAAADANYSGEENTMQGTIDITQLSSAAGSTTSVAIATAAFDEPLTMVQVNALLQGSFIVGVFTL